MAKCMDPPLLSFMKKQHRINCKNKSTHKMQMHFFVLNYYLMEVDGGLHASLYVYSIWYPIVLNVILNINLRWFRILKTNLKCNFSTSNHVLTTPQWQFSVSGHNWKSPCDFMKQIFVKTGAAPFLLILCNFIPKNQKESPLLLNLTIHPPFPPPFPPIAWTLWG